MKRYRRWNAARLRAWSYFGGFESVGDRSRLREMQLAAQPLRGRDVGRDVGAEKSPDECQQPKLAGGEPALSRIASQAFHVAACHEVAWTGRTRGLDQKLTVGTDRLKAVVFNDHRFVPNQAQEQG